MENTIRIYTVKKNTLNVKSTISDFFKRFKKKELGPDDIIRNNNCIKAMDAANYSRMNMCRFDR